MTIVSFSINLLLLFAAGAVATTFSQPPGNDYSSSCSSSYSMSGTRAPVSFTVDSSWGGYDFDVRIYDSSGSSYGRVDSWTVPSSGGTYSKNIEIPSSACGKNVYIMMDGYLAYNYYSCYFSSQSCASLSISSPSSSTKVDAGSSLNIRWSSSGISSVKIQYTNYYWASWYTVTSSTSASAGSYTWTVPASTAPGTSYYIRISDASDSSFSKQSSYFEITEGRSLSISSPSSSTKVDAGSSLNIRWSSSGISSVKIQYTNTAWLSWSTVTSSTSASAGSYTWTVPASTAPGTLYYIRISDASDSSFSRESSYFEIQAGEVSGSGCEILDTFQDTSSDYCPNFSDHDEDSMTVRFRCWGYEGYDVDLRLYRDHLTFDDYVSLGSFSFNAFDETKTTTVAIPQSFRSCSFSSLYFSVYYSAIYYYSGCYFLPTNHNEGLECDRVLYPTGGEVIPVGPSKVEWELEDPADWQGWDIEWYLYQEVDLWPDPWWYPGKALATSASMNYNIEDLSITTSEGSTWYLAGYYRTYGIFTFSVAESNRFAIDDGVAVEHICSLENGQEKFAVDCCQHLSTTNDFCRLPIPGASLAFEARDVSLYWIYEPAMCEAPIQFDATIRTHWIDGDGNAGFYDVVFTQEYGAAELLNQEYYQQVIDETALTGIPGLSSVVAADSGLRLVTTCVDNGLDLRLSLYGQAEVLGVQAVDGDFMEIYTDSFPLPTQPMDSGDDGDGDGGGDGELDPLDPNRDSGDDVPDDGDGDGEDGGELDPLDPNRALRAFPVVSVITALVSAVMIGTWMI